MGKGKCIVTGGAGFIGSHLCEQLLVMGYNVVCIDNLYTGSLDNIVHLKTNPDFSFLDYNVIAPLPESIRIDYLFHLASPASVLAYQRLAVETALVNSLGTHNLLKFVHRQNARFLFASTSEIYGDPQIHPQPESYWGNVNPNGIRACYDESKRFGEMLSKLYFRNFEIDTRIIRIFNTYGPRMQKTDGRIISNFINQALAGEPITVYGDGNQTRSFCYVSDMVNGIVKAMFTEGLAGEVMNLGNPDEYRIIQIAEQIKKLTASKSSIVYKDLPEDDPTRRRPDISKAINLLHWQPVVDLETGLKKTIKYYQSNA
ncbi:hypothetical protein A2154_00140 [Candidatus Gottesmanbacteria bacterium RBG_16_43_7]|uniref:NAD-dependent epimerase/dehydratase domain-containing protein n=1 Tax=Candidatus Gottesmanbacteria bacterium RBG_16_43_7 TaxID=1798373 RepID=A0A1F5ZCI5_9BACT|nr:MAG: hypothetical protein A2154_00140 [Candidatus Gottesmanbacteria bacterium RBG_16_43_7]